MDKGLLAKILFMIGFILFVIAAVQAAYASVQPWMVPGGLAAVALAFVIA